MTVTAKCLIEAKYAEASEATQYAAPAASSVLIDKFTATNVSASDAALTVHLVPGGTYAASDNIITKDLTLAAGQTRSLAELAGHVLDPTDCITTTASAASAIVIRASGRVVSQ